MLKNSYPLARADKKTFFCLLYGPLTNRCQSTLATCQISQVFEDDCRPMSAITRGTYVIELHTMFTPVRRMVAQLYKQ